jgi:methylated-DNA-protein-cysteine methyltransferase-like protein
VSFRAAVYALVRRIPPGQVATYGQVAALVGRARAARAVGGAMGCCPGDVPWHRVVNAQGGISRRRRESGMLTQRIRLEQEGIRLQRGRVRLARYQWDRGDPRSRHGGHPPRQRGETGVRTGVAKEPKECGWR